MHQQYHEISAILCLLEMYEQNQMKASQEDGDRQVLVKVMSGKWRCLSTILKRLGSICAPQHETNCTPQTKTVVTAEKACGTQDDIDTFIDTFEEKPKKDFDNDLADDDNVVSSLEIYEIYEGITEDDLVGGTSPNSFESNIGVNTFEEKTENYFDTDDSDNDDVVNNLCKETSVHSFTLDTDSESECRSRGPVGPPHRAWEDDRSSRK
ncbi:uncharacterized protein LOC114632952 [Grammomys surdaster]|uniref:uncharacterized protein LOC114632952 n=1 Tax=Grammomys surdaster TaxID=491861 RepID=UPI00109F520D|nr:uncharacterized protein LOC114632952 [Grammomys surdaster]